MYCTKCGSYNADDNRFCASCGQPMHDTAPAAYGRVLVSQKSMGVAILISIFIPGAGQMYSEKVMRGLIVLAVSVVCLMTFYLSFISVVLWVYSLVDSYSLVNSWNRQLAADPYTRPW